MLAFATFEDVPQRPPQEDAMLVPVRSYAPAHAITRILVALLIACAPAPAILAATFTVNSAADVVDENPGDGICRTASDNTVCTLRAAIMEANALPGADVINLQANTTYVLTRPGPGNEYDSANGDLDILDSVTIVGAGPDSTIIDGNGVLTGDRVMEIVQCIGNAAPISGGACPGDADVVVDISGVAFRHGQTGVGGGGILNSGVLKLENCAITDNTSTSAGGGVYALSQAAPTQTIVIRSTISGNHANQGGGISLNGGPQVTLINTTISGNFSTTVGGGIDVTSGTVGLYNVTITANEANADATGSYSGGGINNSEGIVTLANSIITGNAHRDTGSLFVTLDDCSGALQSQGNNLVTNVKLCTIVGPNSTAAPLLGPLQDNGGPTLTHALLPGSPAIDAGNSQGCTDNFGAPLITDQRGVHRPVGAFCDIGAYEFNDLIFTDGFGL